MNQKSRSSLKMNQIQGFLLSLQTLLITAALASSASELPQSASAQSQSSGEVQLPASGTSTSGQQQLKLPKINIYINRSEILKLLGIQSQINYVTNGNINAYPFNFAIPLGLNQSDIIFTWQNLGTTNVNYSISLAIHNLEAVDPPLINITRTGLIPKHEQVFKITLPCSGKVNDEVDVQVLINISGYAAADDDDATSSGSSPSAKLGTDSISGNASELAQSDQAPSASQAGSKQQQQQQLVSHTLAIKRKKICTAHQVSAPAPADPFQLAAAARRPEHSAQPKAVVYKPTTAAPSGSVYETRWPPNQPPPPPQYVQSMHQQQQQQQQQPTAAEPSQPNAHASAKHERKQQAEQVATNRQLTDFPSSQPPAVSMGPSVVTWPFAPRGPALPASPIPDELINLIAGNPAVNGHNRMQHSASAPVPAAAQASTSPFLPSLVAISLLISIVLVVVIILVASPLDKLNRITRCLLNRAPASVSVNKCKSPMAGAVISSLRAGPKSVASSVSGLSAISGHSKSQPASAASYCYKTNCTNGYFTSSNQYQQQHYQHPPTADLLGTGYQCQPPPQYPPIYHIATGNSNQTTRLIWQNGNGTNPDGFTIDGSYMPLSNAPRSDNGSVYQYIS